MADNTVQYPLGMSESEYNARMKTLGFTPEQKAAMQQQGAQPSGQGESYGYSRVSGNADYQKAQYDKGPALQQEQESLINQNANDQIAYAKQAVQKSTQDQVNAYQRAWEDAQAGFNNAKAYNAYQKAQAGDNLALRNAAAGDQGGIGQKQYSDSQAAFDSRAMQIELEMTNLKNQTDRGVADAIANGDVELARQLLEIGTAKMNNLMSIKQNMYSQMNNLAQGIDQMSLTREQMDTNKYLNLLDKGIFDANAAAALGIPSDQAQGYADYINDMYRVNADQAKAELEALLQSTELQKQNSDLDKFYKLLSLGIFDGEAAAALGVPSDQAQQYANYINTMFKLNQDQAKAELNALYKQMKSSTPQSTNVEDLYKQLASMGVKPENAESYLRYLGYTKDEDVLAYMNGYKNWYDGLSSAGTGAPSSNLGVLPAVTPTTSLGHVGSFPTYNKAGVGPETWTGAKLAESGNQQIQQAAYNRSLIDNNPLKISSAYESPTSSTKIDTFSFAGKTYNSLDELMKGINSNPYLTDRDLQDIVYTLSANGYFASIG